jgi:hypothetical protein
MADLTKLGFFSEVNYLKKDISLSGSQSVSITTGQLYTTITINHNLGYIPFYTFAANLTNDGIIWSSQTMPRNIQNDVSRTTTSFQMFSYCTTTSLVLGITNTNPPVNATVDFFYNIYLDYGT